MISRKTAQEVSADRPWLYGVLDILHQAVVVLDRSHHILAASKPFYHLIGMMPQAAVGRHLRDVGNRLLDAPALEAFLGSIESSNIDAGGFRFEANMGLPGRRTLALSARRIPENLASGATIVAIEETAPSSSDYGPKLNASPRAEQASPLITAASHALRQPLQTLSLLQGVLAAKEKDPELLKLVRRVEEAIEALTGMLNGVLSVHQLNAGLITPVIAAFPIDVVINRLRTELAYHAAARGLGWRVVPCSATVRSDSHLLGQVLRALLMEAMKLIGRGTVLFGCRRRGSRLVLEIWIKGNGVSAEQQQAALDEFHRRREHPVGSGLAEVLVKPLSDRLNLAVKARARPGNGLVFSAEVPVEVRPAEAAFRSGAAPKGTLVVTSDDPSFRDALVLFLRELGHETLTTSPDDGFATLVSEKSGSMRPEIAIVDFKRGKEFNRKVVSSLRWMLSWEIPAIVMTDDGSAAADPEAIGEPCAYLPRPIRPSELAPHIARLLTMVRHRAASERPVREGLHQTVFVIDDDAVLRDAVRDVLSHQGMNVELFSSSESFLGAYNRDRRGCLVIDNKLPGMTGVELLERLKSEDMTLPSVMITGHGDTPTAVRALKAGAIDYIEKPISYDSLLTAIERALEIDRGSADAHIRRQELAARIAELTPRERQVLDLVVAGRSSKSIAQVLKISQRTVENHRAAIMKRAGASSLPDLIRLVMQLQLSPDH